jgi:hypothetical protein
MADDFFGRVYAFIVDDASVTGERTAEEFMMLSCETFAKVTIDQDTRFGNKFFRTLLGRMGTEVRTVPTEAHKTSHAEKPVHLLRVACNQDCRRECEAISRICACASGALCELDEDIDWFVAPGD